MNKKSGTAGTLSAPLAPLVAKEAAVADPGQVSAASATSRTSSSGPYGSVKTGSGSGGANGPAEPRRKVWISIELRDEGGKPVPDEPYEIRVPGETSPRKGKLNTQGRARVEGIDEGECEVCFPQIDGREWSKIATEASAS